MSCLEKISKQISTENQEIEVSVPARRIAISGFTLVFPYRTAAIKGCNRRTLSAKITKVTDDPK